MCCFALPSCHSVEYLRRSCSGTVGMKACHNTRISKGLKIIYCFLIQECRMAAASATVPLSSIVTIFPKKTESAIFLIMFPPLLFIGYYYVSPAIKNVTSETSPCHLFLKMKPLRIAKSENIAQSHGNQFPVAPYMVCLPSFGTSRYMMPLCTPIALDI